MQTLQISISLLVKEHREIRRAGNPRQNIFDREVPKYTQIGNAVPVKLAKEIGIHFRKILT